MAIDVCVTTSVIDAVTTMVSVAVCVTGGGGDSVIVSIDGDGV